MKTVMVIYEGAADQPIEELDGRTPLQVARCPNADALAASGRSGLLAPVKEGLDARNEVTLAALLGVPAKQALHWQRGPVEAAGLERDDLAQYMYACAGDFVTLDGDVLRECRVHSLSLEETRQLAGCLQSAWPDKDMAFEAVAAGRVVVLCRRHDPAMSVGFPPCMAEGERLSTCLPRRKGGQFVKDILVKSGEVLQRLTLNDVRLDLGENPANALWLWGGGPMRGPEIAVDKAIQPGIMLTQSALARGAAVLRGMGTLVMGDPWAPESAGQVVDETALNSAVGEDDFLMVYVETPKKHGLHGSVVEKIRALEVMDQRVLGPLLSWLNGCGRRYRLLLASDGVGSTEAGCATSGRVPFVMAGADVEPDGVTAWDEEGGARGSLGAVRATRAFRLLSRGG